MLFLGVSYFDGGRAILERGLRVLWGSRVEVGRRLVWMLPCVGASLLGILRLDGASVRVASFNVYNYSIMDRRVEGVYRQSYPKPESEKAAVRQAVRQVQADVLALQEMGGAAFLREFQEDLRAEGLEYPYSVLMEGKDVERHTAVLSKLPFAEVFQHADLEFTYFGERAVVLRGLLEVVFETDGYRWSVFVVHLKSRRELRHDDPKASRYRRAEARACRERVRERYPAPAQGLYLIVGDFNATKGSTVLKTFLQRGRSRLTSELAVVTPAADSNGEVWTYYYRREDVYERVDFLLASEALFKKVWHKAGVIVDVPRVLEGSDHRMLYLDLVF